MSSSTHCPTCAAPIREESAVFCAFCGTKLPEAPMVVVQAWAPNSPERFAAAREHESYERLMAHVPTATRAILYRWAVAVVSLPVSAFLGLQAAAWFKQGTGARILFGGMFVAMAALSWWLVQRARRFQAAPVRRHLVLVADERVSVRGGKHASASYFAMFEFEGGERVELDVSEELASGLVPNDLGILYTKDGSLLGFARIPVR